MKQKEGLTRAGTGPVDCECWRELNVEGLEVGKHCALNFEVLNFEQCDVRAELPL